MGTVFASNTEIEVLDLRLFTGVTMMSQNFAQGMTALRELYFPSNSVTNSGGDARFIESGSPNLVKIVLPKTYQRVKRYSFRNTQKATIIIGDESGSGILSINSYQTLSAALALVIYSNTPPYWHNNDTTLTKDTGSKGTSTLPNGCKIYVPDEAVTAYKNSGADMWGNYASRIYPISEFEGEL